MIKCGIITQTCYCQSEMSDTYYFVVNASSGVLMMVLEATQCDSPSSYLSSHLVSPAVWKLYQLIADMAAILFSNQSKTDYIITVSMAMSCHLHRINFGTVFGPWSF